MMIYWYYYFLSHIIVVVNDERLGSMAMSPSFLMGTLKSQHFIIYWLLAFDSLILIDYYTTSSLHYIITTLLSQIEPIDTQMQKNIA